MLIKDNCRPQSHLVHLSFGTSIKQEIKGYIFTDYITFPIELLLNFCMQRKLITLDISAHPKQWCAEFELFTVTGSLSHPNAFQFNAYLDTLSTQITEITGDYIRRKIPFTNSMIADQLFVDINYEYVCKFVQH